MTMALGNPCLTVTFSHLCSGLYDTGITAEAKCSALINIIALTPVYEMLASVKEKQAVNKKLFKGSYNREYDDYVCTDAIGNLIHPSYVTHHFADLLKKLGLRHIRFHDLRHTFASILINKEVPLINVSNFLGHSTISTTANIYAHLDKSSKQSSADVISDMFGKAKE